MKAIITSKANRIRKFHSLFGLEKFKNTPLFMYAENLFFSGMDQMVADYSGGYFDFVEIVEADVEIEPLGFFPMINRDGDVVLQNPFGMSTTLSFKAASVVVWLFVIEQIANNDVSDTVKDRLYRTIQDIKYCYSGLTNEDGTKIFNEDDCKAIYQLLN